MAYDDTNSGALFRNKQKKTDRHPNLRGSINIEGKEYWVSGWTKEIKNGENAGDKMISLSVTPKDDTPASTGSQGATNNDFDDIPF